MKGNGQFKGDFSQEFFEHWDEFSESWREAAMMQKRF